MQTNEMVTTALQKQESTEQKLELAEALLARSDAQQLYDLYVKSIREIDQLSKAFHALTDHFIGRSAVPRFNPSDQPSSNAIEAMQSVAIAGLETAKAVIDKLSNGGINAR